MLLSSLTGIRPQAPPEASFRPRQSPFEGLLPDSEHWPERSGARPQSARGTCTHSDANSGEQRCGVVLCDAATPISRLSGHHGPRLAQNAAPTHTTVTTVGFLQPPVSPTRPHVPARLRLPQPWASEHVHLHVWVHSHPALCALPSQGASGNHKSSPGAPWELSPSPPCPRRGPTHTCPPLSPWGLPRPRGRQGSVPPAQPEG